MADGWTPERRAEQAALVLTWRPWERSTGPKTEAGKARSSSNADKPRSLNRQMQSLKRKDNALVAQAKEIGL